MNDLEWVRTYAINGGYVERYVLGTGPRQLRIVRHEEAGPWHIRWEILKDRHTMPSDTPLEEVKAVAIALWRME